MSLTFDTSIVAKHYGGSRTLNSNGYIVLHYTANGGTTATAKGNANYFHNPNPDREASAHYVVDKKNPVYQCVPDNKRAYSVGDSGKGRLKGIVTNTNSVSIEMVSCSTVSKPVVGSDDFYIPDETIDRAVELTVMLMKKYGIPLNHVVRHYDVTAKRCPDCMCVTKKGEANWAEFKKKVNNLYNGKVEDDEMVENIKVNLLGTDKTVKGIFKDGNNYLGCESFKDMGLTVTSKGNVPVVNVGKVKVNIDGKNKEIAGFNGNGTNYCSLREIAEILGKKVTWENNTVVIK